MTTSTQPASSLPPPPPPPPPLMALRTYAFLRAGVVVVIVFLAVSIFKEREAAGCLQGSISAYYYLPPQSVFVGSLVALGFVMIVLWGKTPWEDGLMNLAGMLAPVVAFVPTTETKKCGLTDAAGERVKGQDEENEIIRAGHEAVVNNMGAYLWVIAVVLAAMLVVGIAAHFMGSGSIVLHPWAYWSPWAVAVVLWLAGSFAFNHREDWFFENAHTWSAIGLFSFFVLAIIAIGIDRWRGNDRTHDAPSRAWAVTYWVLSAVMVAGAGLLFLVLDHDHRVFWVEAWMIGGLATFWALQTWDRWGDGAPPRTYVA